MSGPLDVEPLSGSWFCSGVEGKPCSNLQIVPSAFVGVLPYTLPKYSYYVLPTSSNQLTMIFHFHLSTLKPIKHINTSRSPLQFCQGILDAVTWKPAHWIIHLVVNLEALWEVTYTSPGPHQLKSSLGDISTTLHVYKYILGLHQARLVFGPVKSSYWV